MNNQNVELKISECKDELASISRIIDALGRMNSTTPFLTKYSIIKSCGTLELCFKTIIADYTSSNQSIQIRNYVDATLRKNSMNPSFKNIHTCLKNFDNNWNDAFKLSLKNHPDKDRIVDSINSLNEARNDLAHGGNPTTSLNDVMQYFHDSVILLEILDTIIV